MTTRRSRFLKSVLIPSLLATLLCTANSLNASSITDLASPDLSAIDDGAASVPPSDFSGWFVTYDPSNEWTDAANIATLESWLATAEQISEDASDGATSGLSSTVPVVPEPATLGLLGIALAILLIYVPIRRPHRLLRN